MQRRGPDRIGLAHAVPLRAGIDADGASMRLHATDESWRHLCDPTVAPPAKRSTRVASFDGNALVEIATRSCTCTTGLRAGSDQGASTLHGIGRARGAARGQPDRRRAKSRGAGRICRESESSGCSWRRFSRIRSAHRSSGSCNAGSLPRSPASIPVAISPSRSSPWSRAPSPTRRAAGLIAASSTTCAAARPAVPGLGPAGPHRSLPAVHAGMRTSGSKCQCDQLSLTASPMNPRTRSSSE